MDRLVKPNRKSADNTRETTGRHVSFQEKATCRDVDLSSHPMGEDRPCRGVKRVRIWFLERRPRSELSQEVGMHGYDPAVAQIATCKENPARMLSCPEHAFLLSQA